MTEYPECIEYPEYRKERKIEDEITDHNKTYTFNRAIPTGI